MEFFRLFAGSFYSPAAYRQMRVKQGNGFGYSAFSVSVITLVMTVYMAVLLHGTLFVAHEGRAPLFDDVVMQIASQVPVMSYTNGQLQTREARVHPIVVEADILGAHRTWVVATIDTTGATTRETMQAPLLITAREAIMRGKREAKTRPLTEVLGADTDTRVINHAVAMDMGQMVTDVVRVNLGTMFVSLGGVVWLVLSLGLYFLRLCMLFALGVSGLLMARVMDRPLDMAESMRLAALGFTPVAVGDALSFALTWQVLGAVWLFLCGVVMLTAALFVTRQTVLATPE